MEDFVLMETFKLRTRKDYEDMRKEVEKMKDTNNRDDMLRTMKTTFNKKSEKEKFQEDSEVRFTDEDKRREFCETLRAPAIWNFWGEKEEDIDHLLNPAAKPELAYKEEKELSLIHI